MTRFIASILTVALALAGCQSPLPDASPRPTLVRTDATFALPEDKSAFFGVSAERPASDSYGDYSAVTIRDPAAVIDMGEANVEPGLHAAVGDARLAEEAALTARLIVNLVIDSPLVFDDSAAAQADFWKIAALYGLDHPVYVDHFASHADPEPFVFVDDDRGLWRQAAGYRPVPYEQGATRVLVQEFGLLGVSAPDESAPSHIEYEFLLAYDRPVMLESGERMLEHVWLRYAVTWASSENGPLPVGLSWAHSVDLGAYVPGGAADLPVFGVGHRDCGCTINDGKGLYLPVPAGWSTTPDPARAAERGAVVVDPDDPTAVTGYLEGPGFNPDRPPYLYYRPDSGLPDPHVSDVEHARIDAGLQGMDLFWPVDAEGGRLLLPGASEAWIRLSTASPGEKYDLVDLEVEDAVGFTHLASYYVEPGEGDEVLVFVAQNLRLDPSLLDGATAASGAR